MYRFFGAPCRRPTCMMSPKWELTGLALVLKLVTIWLDLLSYLKVWKWKCESVKVWKCKSVKVWKWKCESVNVKVKVWKWTWGLHRSGQERRRWWSGGSSIWKQSDMLIWESGTPQNSLKATNKFFTAQGKSWIEPIKIFLETFTNFVWYDSC